MKSLGEIELQITDLYKKFYNEIDIDENTGIVQGTNKMFSGAPFIGSLYPKVNKKLLFVGLDIGSDEGVLTFDKKRERISYTACGKSEIPAEKPFNAHLSGTYAMAFALLYDTIGKREVWEKFSSNEDTTAYNAIKKYHSEIPVELLDYVCFTNAHKLVSTTRINKGGGQDRVWNEIIAKERELGLLKDEIDIIQPEIIIFQGVGLTSIVPQLHLDNSIKTLVTFHPSARDHYHKSIGYIKKMAFQF